MKVNGSATWARHDDRGSVTLINSYATTELTDQIETMVIDGKTFMVLHDANDWHKFAVKINESLNNADVNAILAADITTSEIAGVSSGAKFRGILDKRDLFRPEKHAFALFDVVGRRKTCLLQLFLGVVDDALKGMMHVRHVPVFKQQFFQTIPGHAVCTVVDQDLQKRCQLRLTRLGAAGNQLSVPSYGEPAEHSHIQDILSGLSHPHFI
jgi:hypothetical protein